MLRLALLLVSLTIVCPTILSDCKCVHQDKGETTRWGGNEDVVEVEGSPLKQLQGVVKDETGSPVSNALIEVFTHPEYLLSNPPNARSDHAEQQRVGACLTSTDGKFCFQHLPAATYEIRSSVSSGWDVTHVHVILDPKKGKAKTLVVHMQIGK